MSLAFEKCFEQQKSDLNADVYAANENFEEEL